MNCRQAASAALFVIVLGSDVAADEPSLHSGLYEVGFRLELPHLERYAVERTTTTCVDEADLRSGGPSLPVLSQMDAFGKCLIENLQRDGAGFTYDVVCTGRDAAKARVAYTLAPDQFRGRIAIVQGAKNMTMTEVQDGRRIGSCDIASISRD